MLTERASGIANAEVVADFHAVQAAVARGELRGHRFARVIRDDRGNRRVVPAVGGPRGHARTAADRERRLQQIEASMTSDRSRRIAKAERETLSPLDRVARAQAAVDFAFCRDRVSNTLLPPGIRRVRLIV